MAELLRSAGKREKRFGECLTVSRQGETIWLYLPGGRKVKMEHFEARTLVNKLNVTLQAADYGNRP